MTCFDVMSHEVACGVRCSDVVGCEVRATVVGCSVACDVMSFDVVVTSFDAM